eukprot:TRINITY_DN790_c0_g1_i1.p1 TRINITY_DN790_c0_g1~~TRINITY_DN790_c0_g1_i1.p1  ORF type:complete len:855 (-),score=188.43 TRINITY_DN790_c0_g1_i1:170-2734(-)
MQKTCQQRQSWNTEKRLKIYLENTLSNAIYKDNINREKTERERLQEICEKKDEEILIEAMKQAEKEQYYSNLIANYEERIRQDKASDEQFAMLKIQNTELEAQLNEERTKALTEIERLFKENESFKAANKECESTICELNRVLEQKMVELKELSEGNMKLTVELHEKDQKSCNLWEACEQNKKELQQEVEKNNLLEENLQKALVTSQQFEQKVENAQTALDVIQKELADTRVQLNDAQSKLKDFCTRLTSNETELANSQAQLTEAKQAHAAKVMELTQSFEKNTETQLKECSEHYQKMMEQRVKETTEIFEDRISKLTAELEAGAEKATQARDMEHQAALQTLKDSFKQKELNFESERQEFELKLKERLEAKESLENENAALKCYNEYQERTERGTKSITRCPEELLIPNPNANKAASRHFRGTVFPKRREQQDIDKKHKEAIEGLNKENEEKLEGLNKEIVLLSEEKEKYKNESSLLAVLKCNFISKQAKMEELENVRQEERKRIEDRHESERRAKEDTIAQLRQENKEKERAILNSQAAMQDIRVTINLWQDKVDEKKKLLDEAKETIKSKDTQIAYLREQLKLITESNKANLEANKAKTDKDKKEQLKLQAALRIKEKEVVELKEQQKVTLKKLDEENRRLKTDRVELAQMLQEYTGKINSLELQLKDRQAELEAAKTREGDAAGKENQWYTQALKWKAEADKLKKAVVRLEGEKTRLNLENDMLTGHMNANQKIHLHQKIKEENNGLRTENYKLREEAKFMREKMGKMDKDLQYLQAKYRIGHTEMIDLPSKYEFRIEQLEDKLQKEVAISMELSKLPEVAPLYKESLGEAEPIEQIARAIDYLVQTIRV